METLRTNEIPDWLKFPREYLSLLEEYAESAFVKFPPWYFLDAKLTRLRFDRLKERYPTRRLFPFAARLDNDDIACWEDGKPGRVFVIHDGASEKSLTRKEFASFWDWFRAAVEEMIAHCD